MGAKSFISWMLCSLILFTKMQRLLQGEYLLITSQTNGHYPTPSVWMNLFAYLGR